MKDFQFKAAKDPIFQIQPEDQSPAIKQERQRKMKENMKKKDHDIISKEMDEFHKLLLRHAKKWNIHFATTSPQENTDVIIEEIEKNIEQDIEKDLNKLEIQSEEDMESEEIMDNEDPKDDPAADEDPRSEDKNETTKDKLEAHDQSNASEEQLFEDIEAVLERDEEKSETEVSMDLDLYILNEWLWGESEET